MIFWTRGIYGILTLDRFQMREERAAEFERAMKEHQEQLKRMNQGSDSEDGSGSQNESDDEDREWGGFEEPPAVDYEAEYVDEDKYTTVTVEEMDPSREGLLKSAKTESDEDEDEDKRTKKEEADHDSTAPTKKRKTKPTDKPKKKTKKFRYESKEDRKLNLLKQRLSNKKKAAARRER